MEIRGYKRIKKKDIKRWFKGSNLIVYILILLLLLLILLFAFKTIVSMHNDNVSSDSDDLKYIGTVFAVLNGSFPP